MAKFYYFDDDSSKPMTDDHDSGIPVTESYLKSLGLFYRYAPSIDDVNELAIERNYKNRDNILLNDASFPGGKKSLDEKLEMFFKEHLHEDEEIRYIVEGEGFFDVRDKDNKWIRAKLFKNDLLILPAGIYHRFTLSNKRSIEAIRLFKDEPKWVALNRSQSETDNNKYRKEYLKSIS